MPCKNVINNALNKKVTSACQCDTALNEKMGVKGHTGSQCNINTSPVLLRTPRLDHHRSPRKSLSSRSER